MKPEQRRRFADWERRLAGGTDAETITAELLDSTLFRPEEWSATFERLWQARSAERKQSGSFYTPEPLVEAALGAAWPELPERPDDATLTVLDPACGTGNFLVAAAGRYLAERRPKRTNSKLKLLGVDLSPAALMVARKRLAVVAPDIEVEFHCADALTLTGLPPADLVAGNPPFVNLRMIASDTRTRLARRFRFATGRFNLFTLFMERAMTEWLKPDGIGCLVVPDRLLRNTQLAGFRNFLVRERELLNIVEPTPTERRFQAVVDCIGVIWRNRPPQRADYRYAAGDRMLPATGFPENLFARQAAVKAGNFPVVELGTIADIRDGIIQSKIGDVLFRHDAPHAECRKLLTGADIVPGRIEFHHRYVDYRPAFMRELERSRGGNGLRLRSPELFTRPKILSRQTADRIIAAFDRHGEYCYANTLHGIFPRTDGIDGEYLTLYLNSDHARDAYRALSGETGRVFAQIKIAILKRLPVVLPPPAVQRRIVSHCRRLAQARGDEAVASGIVFDDFNG